MMEAKVIHLVDGKKTENGYEFSDYSEPRKPNNGSMADFMLSTYSGEYAAWYDETKTVIDTVLDYLNGKLRHKDTENDTVEDFLLQAENVKWKYDGKVFFSEWLDGCAPFWIDDGMPTGDVFKIDSIRRVREGQTYGEGEPIDF